MFPGLFVHVLRTYLAGSSVCLIILSLVVASIDLSVLRRETALSRTVIYRSCAPSLLDHPAPAAPSFVVVPSPMGQTLRVLSKMSRI